MGLSTGRGRFIVLEGPDGAGKSLQAARLADALHALGHAVTLTREPGGTLLGERIRDLLLSTDAILRTAASDVLLFNAARSQLVRDVISPALERGETVVCDRFAESTVAYQGFGSGVDVAWLRRIESFATGGLRADRIVLLDIPVAEGLARRSRGAPEELTRFERSTDHDESFHERVRDGYVVLAAEDPQRWRVVEAARDVDLVAADVLRAALPDDQDHGRVGDSVRHPSGEPLRNIR